MSTETSVGSTLETGRQKFLDTEGTKETEIEQIVLQAEKERLPWWIAAKNYLQYLGKMAATIVGTLDDPTDEPDYISSPSEMAQQKETEALEKFEAELAIHLPDSEVTPEDTGVIFIWIGIGTSPAKYQSQIDYFVKKGFICHCVPWDKFDRKEFDFAQHPDYMERKMRELGYKEGERVSFIGHSRGGLAALKFAKEHPEMLNCATISSAPAGHGLKDVPGPLLSLIRHINKLSADKIRNIMEKLEPYVGANETAAFFLANDPHELTDCYLSHMEEDWTETIAGIPDDLRMAFTFGEADSIVEIVGNTAVNTKRNSIRVKYPDKGHALPSGEELHKLLGWCLSQKAK